MLYEGGQREALKNRERIRPWKAYWCFGLFGIRCCCTKEGKAARIGK